MADKDRENSIPGFTGVDTKRHSEISSVGGRAWRDRGEGNENDDRYQGRGRYGDDSQVDRSGGEDYEDDDGEFYFDSSNTDRYGFSRDERPEDYDEEIDDRSQSGRGRGFAPMDPEERRDLSRRGGRTVRSDFRRNEE